MGMRVGSIIGLAALLALSGVACSSGGAAIGVTEKDFEINLDETSADAGEVTFDITNDGPSEHEFVVFKTDLAEDALPLADDGSVSEEGEGLEVVDEVEDIAPDSSPSLTVDLDAGSYVIICNLPGHYKQGMHTSFEAE